MVCKLNEHYSMTCPGSVYDEEALTALELAARTAKKVNECVDEVNKIPQEITDEVQRQINDGTFDDQVDKYAGELKKQIADAQAENAENIADVQQEVETAEAAMMQKINSNNSVLNARMDSLIAAPEGSTQMDTEILDARVGFMGSTYPSLGEALRGQILRTLHQGANNQVTASTVESIIPDADNTDDNTVYVLQLNEGETAPANFPFETMPNYEWNIAYLITLTVNTNIVLQILFNSYGKGYHRTKYGNWTNWRSLNYHSLHDNPIVSSANMETMLPDANNAEPNTVYCINIAGGANAPANMPWETIPLDNQSLLYLITFSNNHYAFQIIFSMNHMIYVRFKAVDWLSWHTVYDPYAETDIISYVNIDAGKSSEYMTLREALEMAASNATASTHYIVNFHGDGTPYHTLSDYTEEEIATDGFWGVRIPAYTTLRGVGNLENNILTCDYDREQNINVSTIDMTASASMENMIVHGYNCRYAVHSDFPDSGDGKSTVRNCHIYSWGALRAFGAGTRSGAHWKFENCIFQNDTAATAFACHNNFGFTEAATLEFDNCRFYTKDSAFGVGFGSLTDKYPNSANGIVNNVIFRGCRTNGITLYEESAELYGTGILFRVSGYGNDAKTATIINTDGKDYSSRIDLI